MPDTPPLLDTPPLIEPQQDFLGFLCEKCGKTFPIIGPLDLTKTPRDTPMTIGARGPLSSTCTHCGHDATYSVTQLIRFSA
jgi:hypothetical protein